MLPPVVNPYWASICFHRQIKGRYCRTLKQTDFSIASVTVGTSESQPTGRKGLSKGMYSTWLHETFEPRLGQKNVQEPKPDSFWRFIWKLADRISCAFSRCIWIIVYVRTHHCYCCCRCRYCSCGGCRTSSTLWLLLTIFIDVVLQVNWMCEKTYFCEKSHNHIIPHQYTEYCIDNRLFSRIYYLLHRWKRDFNMSLGWYSWTIFMCFE